MTDKSSDAGAGARRAANASTAKTTAVSAMAVGSCGLDRNQAARRTPTPQRSALTGPTANSGSKFHEIEAIRVMRSLRRARGRGDR